MMDSISYPKYQMWRLYYEQLARESQQVQEESEQG